MLYKLLLSNLVNAAVLSIWFNLSHVGFYRSKDDAHYRVEFHEVGGLSTSQRDDHITGSGSIHSVDRAGHDAGHDAGHGHH